MAFYEHDNLKIDVIRVFGRILDSSLQTKTLNSNPTLESYYNSVDFYELVLFPPCNRTFYYNGVEAHIEDCCIVLMPHAATEIVNPPIKEYRVEDYQFNGHIAFQFSCDKLIAKEIEVYPCSHYFHEIKPLFEKMRNTWSAQSIGYKSTCVSLIYQIFAMMQKMNNQSYLPKEQYQLIEKTIEYMDNNYLKSDFNCSDLAVMAGISMPYYNKIFAKKFNTSPKQYLINKKLNHAKDLIVSSNLSITEISEYTGFQSVYHFSRLFKKHFNMSPLTYKKNYYNNFSLL